MVRNLHPPEAIVNENLLQRWKRYDDERPNFAGEHWLVLAGGIALWLATRRHPSFAVRLAGSVLGTLAVARAATGREVPPKMLRYLPYADRH